MPASRFHRQCQSACLLGAGLGLEPHLEHVAAVNAGRARSTLAPSWAPVMSPV